MLKKGFYLSGIVAFLLLIFVLTRSLNDTNTSPPVPGPQPTAINVSSTPYLQPTIYLSPRPTSPLETGSCCSVDKKLQGWICVTATCVGVPYPEGGVKESKCVFPNKQNQYNICQLDCLSSSTVISTASGLTNVKELKVGQMVWSVNKNGQKELQPVLKLSQIDVGRNHQVVHLVLSDGRNLDVSFNHPSAQGFSVGQLKEGDEYDGAIIEKREIIPYKDTRTYDLLPAGETGFYYANGILMGSTLK